MSKIPKHEFVDQFRVTLRALQRGAARRGHSFTIRADNPELAKYQRDPAWSVVKIGRVELDRAAKERLGVPSGRAQALVREIGAFLDRTELALKGLHPDARAEVGELLRQRPVFGERVAALAELAGLDDEAVLALVGIQVAADAELVPASELAECATQLEAARAELDALRGQVGSLGQAGGTEAPKADEAPAKDPKAGPEPDDLGDLDDDAITTEPAATPAKSARKGAAKTSNRG